MSYSVHITRKKNWFDTAGPIIIREEWLSIIGDDPELTLESPVSESCYASWCGKCEKFSDPRLCFSEGHIYTEGFDWALVDKMAQIANRLGAKVQGQDGEIYSSDGAV